jgi:hypothetical protein
MADDGSTPRTLVIALVALQPSAPAVLIKTWIYHNAPPETILLLDFQSVR